MKIIATDLEFFRLIAAAGCCNLEQARKIYEPVSNNKWYHYKRVQRLEEEGYIIKRDDQTIELALRGAEAIGETKYRFRNTATKKSHIHVADIILSTRLKFVSNRDIRHQYNLNRRTYFKGGFEINDNLYLLYIINEETKINHIKQMHTELLINGTGKKLNRSIILFQKSQAIGMFGSDSHNQQELIVLPYSVGTHVLENYFEEEFQTILGEKIPKEAKPSAYPFADYETSEEYYTFLVLHDLVKRKALENYHKTPFPKKVNIICLESQAYMFSQFYNKINIITIEDEKLIKEDIKYAVNSK